jgi:DNA-binding response OmpR family regulator
VSETDEKASILIVDDSANVTKAMAALIRDAGYDPVPCLSAAEALAWVGNRPVTAAVVDIHLPDMSGLILAQKLRERFGQSTPIIVVSGDTSMETLNSLPHVGATYFFSKPISAAKLLEKLKTLLGEARIREAG